jgi:hypothetical protein
VAAAGMTAASVAMASRSAAMAAATAGIAPPPLRPAARATFQVCPTLQRTVAHARPCP